MFIRAKSTPNSPRKSIQIVESIRKNGKVSQKIVRHVGIATDEAEEKMLRALGEEIITKITVERINNDPNGSLFPPITANEIKNCKKPGRPKKKAISDILPTSQVSLDDIVEKTRVIEGVHDVAGAVYDDLYARVLKSSKSNRILKDIVMARIANPSSKLRAQSALLKQFNINHKIDAIYRMMDNVHSNIDRIKSKTFKKTKSLFPEGVDVLLFDVTTLYFESTAVDELRNYGYSKDHRFNTTQLVLALATNSAGLPIGYELFEGNKAEVKTLIAAIESWNKLFSIRDVCFVGDRAMMSKQNIELLKRRGYKYIIAAKLRSMPSKIKEQIKDENNYRVEVIGEELTWTGEFSYNDSRLVVNYRKKRALKDFSDRKKILDKIEKKLSENNNAKNFITNNGVKKYTVINNAITQLDEEKIASDAKWDGLHGIITNIPESEAKAASIIARYASLWRIEESFRINKHTLKMRPIFHWKPERIKAHIAICYMAFSTLRHLEYRVQLRQKISITTIIDELLNTQSSIYVHKVTKDLYRVPGRFSNIANKIYRALDLQRSMDAEIYLP